MIVITTPTGDIGSQVLASLLGSGEQLRAIVRDPARLAPGVRERVEVIQGSHDDADVVAKAFAGASAVFWLVPPDRHAVSTQAAYLDFTRPACEAFKAQGVGRVVGVSALGRGTPVAGRAGLVTASLAMDDLIASTGASYRALAMPSFMDNLLRQAEQIGKQGLFFSPLDPDRKAPTCATRDIAAVATRLLLDDGWTGNGTVPVLGPEDLSLNDQAEIMSDVLGRPVRVQRTPVEVFRSQLAGAGMSEAIVQAMADMVTAKDEGLDNGEPRTPESSTPTTFRHWCEEVLKPAVEARTA